MDSPSKDPPVAPFILFGVVMALASLPFLSALPSFQVHSEMTDLLAGDQRSLSSFKDANSQLANTIGSQSAVVLVSIQSEDVFSPKTISQIVKITTALTASSNITHNFSLASPRINPSFKIDSTLSNLALHSRLSANNLALIGHGDFNGTRSSLGNLVHAAAIVGPALIRDTHQLKSAELSVVQKTLIRARVLSQQAQLAGAALSLAHHATNEWSRFEEYNIKPFIPLTQWIKTVLNREANAPALALGDIRQKIKMEIAAVKQIEKTYDRPIFRFDFTSIFPKPITQLSPDEINDIRKWTTQFPFFRNLIVDGQGRNAMIFAFAQKGPTNRVAKAAFCRDINERLQPFRDAGHDIRVLSFPHGEVETMEYLEQDLKRFAPAMFGIVFIVLLITFRGSLRLVLFVMTLQIAGIALTLGLAPSMDSHVSPFTAPLFPLLAGIHLTLLIHMGTALQTALRSGHSGDNALSAMLGQIFQPSGYAALTTCVGLFSLTFSEVRPTAEFGRLGAAGISLLFALTFGPGIVLLKLLGGLQPLPQRKIDHTTQWLESLPMRLAGKQTIIFAATTITLVVIIVGLQKIRTDIRIVEFLNPQSNTRLSLESLDQSYGGINFAKLEIDTGKKGGVRSGEFFGLVNHLHEFTSKQSGVSMTYSLGGLIKASDEIIQRDLPRLAALTPASLRASIMLDQFDQPEVRKDLPLLDSLYNRTRQKGWFVLRTQDLPSREYITMLKAVETEAKQAAPEGWKISMQGPIQAIQKADRQIVESQKGSALFTTILIALVLAVLWRSAPLALLAFTANIIPVGLVVAVQGLADVPLNSITIMVAAIAFGVAVDDTIHFITHWQLERKRGAGTREAVLRTLRVKATPIISTTVILMAVMGVFSLASFPPVVAFGWLSAIGYLTALTSALILIPAALCWRK